MNDGTDSNPPRNFLVRIWRYFWSPTARFSAGTLLAGGLIAGVVFWGGFHWSMELSNKEAFCVSCHEMEENVYKELQGTIHFANRTGIRAFCADCHVPKEWLFKVRRKIYATNELLHKALGTVDTPEKFEAQRMKMAVSVWNTMKSTDSRECRNCHANVWMDLTKQFGGAQRNHEIAMKNELTCIDCHQGIAHRLPKDFVRPKSDQLTKDPNAWLDTLKARQ